MEVFKGFGDEHFDKSTGTIRKGSNADLSYFYPTQVLVTAPEILFFWVARMIIAGYEYTGQKPFEDVYLTGIVRDKLGRKMSKSLGNSPDPLELIEKYGADGVRTGMLFSSPAGNDLPFDEKLCEQGRNFANKIWNAFRLIKGWTPETLPVPSENKVAAEWFESRLNASIAELNDHYSKFRISDALLTTYKLVWDDFCAWYLEMIKPEFGKPIDSVTYHKSIELFEKLLKLLHPFMPFITEELWHELKERSDKDCIITASWPEGGLVNNSILKESEFAFATITELRNTRNSKNISPKEKLNLLVKGLNQTPAKDFWNVVKKLSNLESVLDTQAQPSGATGFLVGSTEMFIPLNGLVDKSKERETIQKEIDYQLGFVASVDKKLGNEKFVSNAKPEVVEIERKKKADAEAKLAALRDALKNLG